MDPDDPDIMKLKPRNPKETILHGSYTYTILNGILIGFLTLLAFLFGLMIYTDAPSMFAINTAEISRDALTHAQTMAFVTLSFSQLMHSMNLRSKTKSIFQVGFFTNKYLIGAILAGVLIQVALVYIPFFRNVFDIHILNAQDLLLLLAVSVTPIIVNEIVKYFALFPNRKTIIA